MNCCPTSVLDLGCFPCSVSLIPITGATWTLTGTWSMTVIYHGLISTVQIEAVMGEPLKLPVSTLNENYLYTAQIYDPNEELFTFDGADGFKFKRLVEI